MRRIIFIFALFTFLISNLFAQDLSLNISYIEGVKSKDSYSFTETYVLNAMDISYAIDYKGIRYATYRDSSKQCLFTEQDIANIKNTITTKGLNTNLTLTEESSKPKSFRQYCNIVMDLTLDGTVYGIKMNGDKSELNDNQSYNDMVFFVTLLRKMVKDCN